MNIIEEIQSLPRRSQLELAVMILKKHKPTLGDLAEAGGISDKTAARWFLTRQERNTERDKDAERYRRRNSGPIDPELSARMDASLAAMKSPRQSAADHRCAGTD